MRERETEMRGRRQRSEDFHPHRPPMCTRTRTHITPLGQRFGCPQGLRLSARPATRPRARFSNTAQARPRPGSTHARLSPAQSRPRPSGRHPTPSFLAPRLWPPMRHYGPPRLSVLPGPARSQPRGGRQWREGPLDAMTDSGGRSRRRE